MSVGLQAPANPAQFWELPGTGTADAAAAGAAQAGAGTASNIAKQFLSAAGGALSAANPVLAGINAAAGVAQAAVGGPTSLDGKTGGASFGMTDNRIFNFGGGKVSRSEGLPVNPWMIGGMVLAGLVALRIMKG